jgi:hypothetical protein
MNNPLHAVSLLVRPAMVLLAAAVIFGCSSDSDSPSGAGTVITVTGRVIDGSSQPIPNTPVIITGLPATTTDANGSFTVTGVTTPYDVTAILSASKISITYKGLTRSDPVIYFTGASLLAPNSATVSGTVSGGAGYPLLINHANRAMFVSPEVFRSTTPNFTTGAYSMSAGWTGAATITGTLHALQWETDASGLPSTYTGYVAKPNVALTAGGTFANQNLALTAVTGSNVSGTVTLPAGLTLSNKRISLAFNSLGAAQLGSDATAGTAFNFVVPNIAGAIVVLSANAASGALGTSTVTLRSTPGASNVGLVLQPPPQHSLPVSAATGITTASPFSWTPVTGGVYVLVLNGPAGEPSYFIVTTATSGQIPDLSAQGLGLGASKNYTWQIHSLGPFTTMDAATGPIGVVSVFALEGWQSTSGSRAFTTAP